jgi:erythromycin esterase
MAGFDMTATRPFADLANELRSYVGGLRDAGLRERALTATEEVVAAFSALNAYVEAQAVMRGELIGVTGDALNEAVSAWERDIGAPLRPKREALDRLRPAVDRLAALFESENTAFAAIEGERRRSFMAHNLANLGERGLNLYQRFGADLAEEPDAVAQENRRDALNSENMRWLIEEGFPGEKLIVWAHNAHVMNAYYLGPDFKTVSPDPAPNAMKPMGVFLAEQLGDALYTIGFTAYEGEDGWVGLQSGPIAPATDGSVEARLNQLGLPYAFLDLRAPRSTPDHPLRAPQTVRVPKYDEVQIDPTRPYDALFFIARMERGVLIRDA